MEKERVFEILEKESPADIFARPVRVLILFLIVLNLIAVILESVPSISSRYYYFFLQFERISVSVFTVEYFLRLWSCTADNCYEHPVRGRARFALKLFTLADLFAILPFFLSALIPMDLRFIRMIRLFRILRLFRLGQYSRAVEIFGKVIQNQKEELLVAGVWVVMLFLMGGSLLFLLERRAGNGSFSHIPEAVWWVMKRVAGVGGGEVSPVTTLGEFVSVGLVLAGRIALFALPAAILSSGFLAEIQKRRVD